MRSHSFKRAAESVGRFLFVDASPNTRNPIHQLTGKRLRPSLTLGASAVLIGGGALSAHANIRASASRGVDYGLAHVPRYMYDGIAGGDPTLGATGDIVFGLYNLSKM